MSIGAWCACNFTGSGEVMRTANWCACNLCGNEHMDVSSASEVVEDYKESIEWAVATKEDLYKASVALKALLRKAQAALEEQDPYTLSAGDLALTSDREGAVRQEKLRDEALAEIVGFLAWEKPGAKQ